MYPLIVEDNHKEYFKSILSVQEGTLVFDAIFLDRPGGIGRDSRYLDSTLKKYNLQYLIYKGQKTIARSNNLSTVSAFELNISSILGIRSPDLPVSKNRPIWFPQFTSWDIRDRKAGDFIRVHDLFPITNPEWFPLKQKLLFTRNVRHLNSTNRFVANSRYTADCLINTLGISHRQIDVLPCKVEKLSDVKCKKCDGCHLQLSDEFALAVGTIEPRKNYKFLIQNWVEKKTNLKLVIVGRNGWKSKEVLQLLNSNQAKIIWLKDTCDASLQDLYKSCKYYISVSLDEGFDLPTAEANLYGCSLILSDIPVHRGIQYSEATKFRSNSEREFRKLFD